MRKTTLLSVMILAFSLTAWCAEFTEAEILGQAEARIEKFRKGDAVLKLLGPDGESLPAGVTARIEQSCHHFLFGCNIFRLGRCRTPQDNAAYEKHFAGLLNFATLPFYWWNYTRVAGRPDDARTDRIVRWCKAHNVTTKGHPLAWNWGEPRWLPGDPAKAMDAQFRRISRCVRRFKNDIAIWDVVNEATHYDRPKAKRDAPRLTEAIGRMGVGPYVRKAFSAARQANPDATLIINDYRTDTAYPEKVLSQLVDEAGKPLYDVIGIQSHMHGRYWGAKRTWEVCERFATFGKPLHFTEVTVVSGPRSDRGWHTTPEGERRQAKEVAEFYTVLFSHPAVEAITWWDFTDQGAWQGAPAGFLRADMTPKPVYAELKRLIKGKWWSQIQSKTEAGGVARFRGFFGQYKVIVNVDERQLTGTFSFEKGAKDPIIVRLN
jgi:GH35 family endo-1,4-beta-xylanase